MVEVRVLCGERVIGRLAGAAPLALPSSGSWLGGARRVVQAMDLSTTYRYNASMLEYYSCRQPNSVTNLNSYTH